MGERRESQDGFGTGLRAALERARERRDEAAADAVPPEASVTSPELALVAGDLGPAATADPAADAGDAATPRVAVAARSDVAFTKPKPV